MPSNWKCCDCLGEANFVVSRSDLTCYQECSNEQFQGGWASVSGSVGHRPYRLCQQLWLWDSPKHLHCIAGGLSRGFSTVVLEKLARVLFSFMPCSGQFQRGSPWQWVAMPCPGLKTFIFFPSCFPTVLAVFLLNLLEVSTSTDAVGNDKNNQKPLATAKEWLRH